MSDKRRTFTFIIGRPPEVLGANSRAPWQVKHRRGRAYAADVGEEIFLQIGGWPALHCAPWENGRLASTHYFRGAVGDADNCVAGLKPIIDVLKVATPRTGQRYQLGILRDDRRLEVLAPERVPSAGKALAGYIKIKLEVW